MVAYKYLLVNTESKNFPLNIRRKWRRRITGLRSAHITRCIDRWRHLYFYSAGVSRIKNARLPRGRKYISKFRDKQIHILRVQFFLYLQHNTESATPPATAEMAITQAPTIVMVLALSSKSSNTSSFNI